MSIDKKISFIIPVYNEEKNLPQLFSELKNSLNNIGYDYEVIFVDDGSNDNSLNILKSFVAGNRQIKLIEFSRNFGKEMAISAGIYHSSGQAAILIDADLQHPVELIPEFLKKWEAGADVVVGVREKNNSEGLTKKIGSFGFYKIMKMIGETEVVPRATDYRLIDQKVIKEFNRFTERSRITRGLIDWLGFKKDYIYFNANKRNDGQAGYSYGKLVRLAMSSFVTHSLFPLKIAGYLGIFITIISALAGLFMVVDKYLVNNFWNLNFSGTALLAMMILFLVGIILCCLGLIALYIASIHGEVVNRPLYVIRSKENLN